MARFRGKTYWTYSIGVRYGLGGGARDLPDALGE